MSISYYMCFSYYRCHRPRDSLFSWSSGFHKFTGLVNWGFLLLTMSGFRLLLENLLKYENLLTILFINLRGSDYVDCNSKDKKSYVLSPNSFFQGNFSCNRLKNQSLSTIIDIIIITKLQTISRNTFLKRTENNEKKAFPKFCAVK